MDWWRGQFLILWSEDSHGPPPQSPEDSLTDKILGWIHHAIFLCYCSYCSVIAPLFSDKLKKDILRTYASILLSCPLCLSSLWCLCYPTACPPLHLYFIFCCAALGSRPLLSFGLSFLLCVIASLSSVLVLLPPIVLCFFSPCISCLGILRRRKVGQENGTTEKALRWGKSFENVCSICCVSDMGP